MVHPDGPDQRHPSEGCPWDQAQSFGTIAPYTIEEAYEVADAIVAASGATPATAAASASAPTEPRAKGKPKALPKATTPMVVFSAAKLDEGAGA